MRAIAERRCLLAGIALAGAFLAAYFLYAKTVGFEGPRAPWDAYGEPPSGPPVEQPICFWTDLAFVIAGLAVLRRLDRAPRDEAANPMSGRSPQSVGLGLLIVWMGPASMLEHGTLTKTWGWFDASSIHWLALYVSGYLSFRSFPRFRAVFWPGLFLSWLLVGTWTSRFEEARKGVSAALLALMGSAILGSLLSGKVVGLRFERRAWPIFFGLAASFSTGIACLLAGARGGPTAPWGHGAWHICCALATYLIFLFLAAELSGESEGSGASAFATDEDLGA